MEEKQIEQKHKRLDLSYAEFEKRNRNLQNSKLDKFYIFKKIGEGEFGQVYRGMNGQTKKEVAIKILDIRIVEHQKNSELKRIRKRLIDEESKLMMKINSPNVLKCYQCFSNRDLKIMIIEYCNHGSLQDKIELSKKIPEEEAISILKQILKGLGECHKLQIIHRDLKPDNILIHNGEMKITDFGFSKKLSIKNENQITKNTILGTPTTMAPQVLQKKPYGLKADIWSIGIIFFQMIFGICPFKTNEKPEEILAVMKGQLSKNFEEFNQVKPSQKVKKFLKQVLIIDVEKRLGWKEVLNHEIFTTENKNLPNNFYRQVQIKKDDEQLFEMEREFLYESVVIKVNDDKSPISQEPTKYNQILSKKEIQRQLVWGNSLSNDQQHKANKIPKIAQFKKFEQSLSLSPDKQQKYSFKQQKIEEIKDGFYNLNYENAYQIHQAEKIQYLPPKQYLKTQTANNGELKIKKYEQSENQGKKPVFKSLRIQQDQRKSTRKTRSPIFLKKHNTPLKDEVQLHKQINLKKYENNDKARRSESPQQEFQRVIQIKTTQLQEKQRQVFNKLQKDNDIRIGQVWKQEKDHKEKGLQIVNASQITNMKRLINRQEDELYGWVRKTHVECLKTEVIFNKIIKVIQIYNLLKIQQRRVIQMMYLLCARCRNNISPIYYEYQKRKHSSVLRQISGLVEKLYKEVTQKYYYYSGLLTKKQNQKLVMVSDWFSKKLFHKDYNFKDIFLTGVQSMAEFRLLNDVQISRKEADVQISKKEADMQISRKEADVQMSRKEADVQMSRKWPQQMQGVLLDYTKEDQIKFTNTYVQQSITNLTHHAKAKQILPYMIHYKEICMIKVEDSTIYNFKETIQYLIRDKTYREQNFF